MDNWAIGGTSWDTDGSTVQKIMPGGELHELYRSKLDLFADFINDLPAGLFAGKIPIIFRPFHEHTGGWFWWGAEHCTSEQYVTLWQFTVKYLRDEKGLNNLLYAYSPDVFGTREKYLEYYPGDEYVDILGFDDYHDVGRGGTVDGLIRQLQILTDLAEEKDKVAALTETGLESITKDDWFTTTLLPIKDDPKAKRIAWALVWRNSDKKHHYGPYKGHPSEDDFVLFYNDPFTVFAGDTPNPYK
jgi:mannan endo-1,4-beta-mannosidase